MKAGSTWNHPVCLNDLMATVAEITGAELAANAGEDSMSLCSNTALTAMGRSNIECVLMVEPVKCVHHRCTTPRSAYRL